MKPVRGIRMKKILIIDYSSMQIRTLTGLMKNKYEIITAMSGFDGIEILKNEKVDLVLLDYGMPVLDGKETLRIIRDNENMKNLPVIFLTGDNEREDIIEALKLNPQGYLLKPVKPDRLFDAIDKALLGK